MSGPFTGTLASILSGEKVNGTDLANWHDILDALTGPWTAYTPTWTGATTNPVLNDGAMVASYRQLGKTVDIKGKITMGAGTTFGSGTWFISLPVTAVDVVGAGAAVLFDTSTPVTQMSGACNLNSTTKIQFWAGSPGATGGTVKAAVPFTWAVGDLLVWSFTYEAA